MMRYHIIIIIMESHDVICGDSNATSRQEYSPKNKSAGEVWHRVPG
jgi:hypothetical protein